MAKGPHFELNLVNHGLNQYKDMLFVKLPGWREAVLLCILRLFSLWNVTSNYTTCVLQRGLILNSLTRNTNCFWHLSLLPAELQFAVKIISHICGDERLLVADNCCRWCDVLLASYGQECFGRMHVLNVPVASIMVEVKIQHTIFFQLHPKWIKLRALFIHLSRQVFPHFRVQH